MDNKETEFKYGIRNYDLLFVEDKALKVDELARKMYLHGLKKEKIRAYMTYLRLKFIEKVKNFYTFEERIWREIGLLTSTDGDELHTEILQDLRKQ